MYFILGKLGWTNDLKLKRKRENKKFRKQVYFCIPKAWPNLSLGILDAWTSFPIVLMKVDCNRLASTIPLDYCRKQLTVLMVRGVMSIIYDANDEWSS